ncbi:MAG: type IIL restriction-modification enzyme MmeI [Opitutaceae bacterium]
MVPPDHVATFISRWSKAEAAERANYALFLAQLCDVLEVPAPDPAGPDASQNAYVFERAVTFHHRGGKTSTGRIDLYKRGSFVCECKQYASQVVETDELALAMDDPAAAAKKGKIARGSEAWDRAMIEAQGQADRYARSLPADEDPPPFLLVVDVGHIFELYADFTQKGKAYLPFPDARAHRIRLADLAREDVRAKLRTIWLDPLSLDPAKVSAAVTREVAGHLAELAKSFEKKHDPATVAAFLSRCLFCMFAEDIELLPKDSFSQLLDSVKGDPGAAVPLLQQLFAEMNVGKFSNILRKKILHFNGGLFAEATALPLNGTQLGLLTRTAKLEWRHVEPAIFGTLLERALNPAERHKLGAHYTPRAYVERLVLPTVVEPLRDEWTGVKTAAVTLASRGDLKGAIKETRTFHHRLCSVRVLDPACGSGNFLYVTLEHLKRLEGEVLQLIESFGENMRLDLGGESVDPHQFLGLEINPRAATIAELVLWIGYLQWHHRNRGTTEWPEPVLRAFKNIECRDAVLAYDKEEFAKDPEGKIRYVWDRATTKVDAVTGRNVPDDKAVVPLKTYSNPRPATWPMADYIIGNPPFLGDKVMKKDLGEGYVETLRDVYQAVPDSADFVMYWWHKASELAASKAVTRFGMITTNSIKQTFNRRVVGHAFSKGVSLRFAIPDHPWVEASDGAAVRIAMTVGSLIEKRDGDLLEITQEQPGEYGAALVTFSSKRGDIHVDLSVGANVAGAAQLESNGGLSINGMMLAGRGFVVTEDEARSLGLGTVQGIGDHLRPIWNGRDLTESPRGLMVIDLFGLTESEARHRFSSLYQHVLTHVKPERDTNGRKRLKNEWWLFGEARKTFRSATRAISRYIATAETAQHRIFTFLEKEVVPEHKLVVIALDDAFYLGILSSRIHVAYSLAAGSTLEDRPVYPATRCFQTFPFPDCTEIQRDRIRGLAEDLDAHRKRAQQKHKLGLTDIYNVLEKIRTGETLTVKDKLVHDAALVSTLKHIHDDLDKAVADAYDWAWPMTEEEILDKVVTLNSARAAEEAKGYVRWLRPDYQRPLFAEQNQTSLGLESSDKRVYKPKNKGTKKTAKAKKAAWPKSMADRAKAVETALNAAEYPVTAADLAKQFARAKDKEVAEILETLAALGRAHQGDEKGTFIR